MRDPALVLQRLQRADEAVHERAERLGPGRRPDRYAIPASAIGDTSVVMTVASGNVVFGDL